MNSGCGNRTPRTFVLAAYTAAWRFVLRRGKTPRWAAWCPLVLYWIRKRKRSENVRTGRVTTAANAIFFSQFHFHLSASQRDSRRRESLPRFHTVVVSHKSRHFTHNHQSIVARAAACTTYRRLGQRSLYILPSDRIPIGRAGVVTHASTGSVWLRNAESSAAGVAYRMGGSVFERARDIFHTEPRDKPSAAVSSATRVAYRVRGSVFERARDIIHTGPRDKPSAAFVARNWVSQPERKVLRPRTVPRDNAMLQRLGITPIQQVQIGVPPELVWRQPRQEPSRIPGAGSCPEVPSVFHRPATSSPRQEQQSEMLPDSQRPAMVQGTIVDPILLNRLTDDVIRRLEQRVRIDRERRGL